MGLLPERTMRTATSTWPDGGAFAARAGAGRRWLRAYRAAVSVAGLLAFAGPAMFFAGAISMLPWRSANEAQRREQTCRVVFRLGTPPQDAALARVRALLAALHGVAVQLHIERTGNRIAVIVVVSYELA